MSLISRLTTWTVGQILKAADLNAEFNNVVNLINNLDAGSTTWTNVHDTTLVSGTSSTGVTTATSLTFGGTALSTYQEGTWTPSDQSGAALTFTTTSSKYTRIGNVVFVEVFLAYPVTADTSNAKIGGLPYTINTYGTAKIYTNAGGVNIMARFETTTTNLIIVSPTGGTAATNANLSGSQVIFSGFYFA